ncbi:MAG: type II toxin-antitoxin system PemK/MazF family toxin [Enterobacterales bacterium]|nr:type II toxin-antitoxin system PemK/MazF family toxin [Enterobacterales bacterium]
MIISSQSYQQERPDVILMAITSQIRNTLTTGEAILQDWQQAGLLKPSLLKPLIATLEKNQIIKVMGQLSTADRSRLEKTIQTILGDKK